MADRRRKFSGLGLFITKNYVVAHDGEISAQSDGPNQGTTLTVKLPVYKGSRASEKDSSTPKSKE